MGFVLVRWKCVSDAADSGIFQVALGLVHQRREVRDNKARHSYLMNQKKKKEKEKIAQQMTTVNLRSISAGNLFGGWMNAKK